MRLWFTIALTVTTFSAFAADPPVPGELGQAQSYCSDKSDVISRRVYTYSREKSDASARRKFSVYEEQAMARNSEATVEALRWLNDNAERVDKAISKVRRGNKQGGAESLANEIAIEALEGCRSTRIAQIRRAKALEVESSTASTTN